MSAYWALYRLKFCFGFRNKSPHCDLNSAQTFRSSGDDDANHSKLAKTLRYLVYRVSLEEWTKIRESVPYVELHR